MATFVQYYDVSPPPLDSLLPDWLPPSAELPKDPQDAFTKALALALAPSSRAAQQREQPIHEPDTSTAEPVVSEHVDRPEVQEEEHLWEKAAHATTVKPTLLTWDTSTQVFRLPPFLSHHPELFHAALRKTLPTPKLVPLDKGYVTTELRSVLVGYSSSLWLWDSATERFVPSDDAAKEIVINGYTPAASKSICERFLHIGTLLRRLQLVPNELMTAAGSWMHAFSHGLTLVLSHIRSTLEAPTDSEMDNLTALHFAYESQEAVLSAVAFLLRRDQAHAPPYRSLPSNIVSALYKALDLAISSSASHGVQCALAFLLQLTTQPCIKVLEESLGLGVPAFLSSALVDDLPEGSTATDDRKIPLEIKLIEGILPPEVRQTLERGRRSLALLKRACPEHVLCGRSPGDVASEEYLRWVWTDEELRNVQAEAEEHTDLLRVLVERWKLGASTGDAQPADDASSIISEPLAAFDLSLLPLPPPGSSKDNEFSAFLASHAVPLMPVSAPTLPLLLHHLPSKLLSRSKVISHALLETLLSPSPPLGSRQASGPDLLAHLHILRSFHLLGFAPFTDLLANALFVHPSPEIAHAPGTRSRVRARLGIAPLPHQVTGQEFAAVGLGVGLSQRGQWPPGGSDLNWILRRVVIDSLALDRQGRVESTEERVNKVWEEADAIVGFAIRDIEEGDDAWLDPLAVEALDFLDLQYRVPRSLAVILSEDAVWKYRRIFSFLLRVLRVDTVVRTIFHPASHEQLFPSSHRSTQLLHCTRFLAQSFVSSLVAYLFDTAIASPWDAFFARLTRLRESGAHDSYLQDVFAVAAYHDSVMDSLLEGCLLRSHQAKLATALKACLGNVLLLGQLVLDRRRNTLSEQDGESKLASLAEKFNTSLSDLLNLLKHYHGKDSERPRTSGRQGLELRRANLADLLLRLHFHEPPSSSS